MEEGDIQGVWDGHVHTAVFKTDNQQGPAVEHKELCSVLCVSLEGREFRGQSGQFSSVAQSCLTLCTPGLPVHHQLPELAQTHVHRAGDAIQPSHPLSPPSPPAFS